MRNKVTKPKHSTDELRELAESAAKQAAKKLKVDARTIWHGLDYAFEPPRPCYVICENGKGDSAVIIYDAEPDSLFSIISAKQRLHPTEIQR